ncbi:atherin-like [Pongo abelii]|uniref:atherin-like n=1 Tax=Pongo abelii TaxID=9601 RepID=UPI0023E828BF|nr:atherin-like [Pongo abelii]
MVAGGLGQRTCPRSRCAARQPRAPAASRLRGSPGAAAAAKRLGRWWRGLRAAPARLSPPLHNGAGPAPPSRTSAEGRGARREESPGPRREGGGRGGAAPRAPPTSPASSLPADPGPRRRAYPTPGTFRSFQESGLRDRPHLLISLLPRDSSLSTSHHARERQWELHGEKATSDPAGHEVSHEVLKQE